MISIIITWRDRIELRQALPKLAEACDLLGGEIIVVNFGGSRELLREQLGELAGAVTVVDIPDQIYFNKSCAQNIGAANSIHPTLFFCDCDIIVEPGLLSDILAELTAHPAAFATLAGVRESHRNSRGGKHVVSFGYELRIRTADGRELRIVDNEEDAEDGTRQAPGLLMVRRADFEMINGYNSRLHGWGWEDQDMIARLTLAAGLERINRGIAIHISHDDHARVAHYPIANRWESRDRMFRQALANYDNADFQGTYAADCGDIRAEIFRAPSYLSADL